MGIYEPTEMMELIWDLHICGCGDPENTYEAVHNMLKMYEHNLTFTMEYEPYMYFMAYTLNHYGFIEHGTSIIGAWLTEKGKELLKALDKFAEYNYDYDTVIDCMPNEFYCLKKEI